MNSAAVQTGMLIGGLIYVALILLMIVGGWKVFEKAGLPGWGVLIPIYNVYLICKMAGKPAYWILLCCIPFVNFIIGILLMLDVAKNFGKGAGFAIGMTFLPFVFWPILGFGEANYTAVTTA